MSLFKDDMLSNPEVKIIIRDPFSAMVECIPNLSDVGGHCSFKFGLLFGER